MKPNRSARFEDSTAERTISASVDIEGSFHVPETVPLSSGDYGDVDLASSLPASTKKVSKLEDLRADTEKYLVLATLPMLESPNKGNHAGTLCMLGQTSVVDI